MLETRISDPRAYTDAVSLEEKGGPRMRKVERASGNEAPCQLPGVFSADGD